jgi:hypothetical protein
MIDDKENVAHYSRAVHLEKILKEKCVRFGPVSELNDPRESSLGWIDTCGYGHEVNNKKWKEASDLKESIGKNLRLFCTTHIGEDVSNIIDTIESKTYGKPRMWAQYGDNSKGFCVILNKNNLTREIQLQTKNQAHIISGEIEYFDWLSLVGGSATIEYGEGIRLVKDGVFDLINSNQMLKSLYFKKSFDWKAEAEFRWLIYSESEKDILVPIHNAIKAVVLGWKFPTSRYQEVKDYCSTLGCSCFILDYQHPKYQLIKIL